MEGKAKAKCRFASENRPQIGRYLLLPDTKPDPNSRKGDLVYFYNVLIYFPLKHGFDMDLSLIDVRRVLTHNAFVTKCKN